MYQPKFATYTGQYISAETGIEEQFIAKSRTDIITMVRTMRVGDAIVINRDDDSS